MFKLTYKVKGGSKKYYVCECGSKETLLRDIPAYKKQILKAYRFYIDDEVVAT